jgi:multiple sugar transport system permease protein
MATRTVTRLPAPSKAAYKRPSDALRSRHHLPWRPRRPDQQLVAYWFLAPWLIGLLGITLGPMIYSLYTAFTNYNLLTAPKWVGFQNFQLLLQDPQFIQSVKVTVTFTLISVPLVLLSSLGLALLLNTGIRGLSIYRTLFYLPSLLGSSAAIAILWITVFSQPGLFSDVMSFFGIHTGSLIGNPRTALYTIVVLNVWAFGATMIIFLAALRNVPREYYESAAIDGAGRWQRFRRVTLPLITPALFFNLILGTVMASQTFTSAYIIGGPAGGPAGSLLFYTVYIYEEGFANFKMGYASAMAWLMLIALGLFTACCFATARFWVHYGDER